MKKSIVFALLSVVYVACRNQKNATDKDSLQTAQGVNIGQITSDTLTVDLIDLKQRKLLNNTQVLSVLNDPVYHKDKKFNVLPLQALLEKYSSLKNLNPAELKVVFECEDGYKPEMSLEKLLSAKAFLAVSDADAPKGREWEQIFKDGHEMKAEPFYVVYEGVSPKDGAYKWPYNLVKIHFAPLNEDEFALKPKDKTAMAGYELYKNRCQTCHAINKVGGQMGPELNYPKSVAEYWKRDDLIAFLQNPADYRNGIKMPKLEINSAQATEIVQYLEYMSRHKI